MNDLQDSVSIVISATPDRVIAFLMNTQEMQRWSLGTWTIAPRGDGLHEGTSLFNGSKILFRIEADAASGFVRWWLGKTPETLSPRILAQIMPGPEPFSAILTLMAWRLPDMDAHRWRRMKATHALEVCLIKDLIEAARPST
jgi:hypothetical protein